MAVLQGSDIFAASGYFLNSTSNFKSDISALSGYTVASLGIITALPAVAISYFVPSLIFSNGLITLSLGQFQNYQSSFARFFGVNASQNSSYLYIKKSDLPLLNNSINPTGEALFIALLLQIQKYECNSLISTVYINTFQHYFEVSPKPLSIWVLVINLYLKMVYDPSLAPIFNNQITNYSTAINPNDFTP